MASQSKKQIEGLICCRIRCEKLSAKHGKSMYIIFFQIVEIIWPIRRFQLKSRDWFYVRYSGLYRPTKLGKKGKVKEAYKPGMSIFVS